MSNPHHNYSHPGPSYYPPPGPHYPYAPAHGGPYYPYPITHMPNGHSPPPHQPASPRMNTSARGGYNTHRAGGPTYQHFPHIPHQHQPYLQPQPMSPAAMTPTSPYSHPQKYPPPHMHHMHYSPPYNPPNGVYSPAWPAPPPTLSPLPKQLSMPAQLQHPLPPTDGSISPATVPQPVPMFSDGPSQPETVAVEPRAVDIPPAPSPSPPPPGDHPESPPPKPAPVHFERPATPTSPASTSSRLSQSTAPPSSFVVWSRKPRDPSLAQGVMISSRAHPPEEMVQRAMDIRTPPQSPKVNPTKILEPVPSLPADLPVKEGDSVDISHDSLEIPSSSATETTAASTAPVTPIAGSPSTTNTSVLAASPVQQTKPLSPVSTTLESAQEQPIPASAEFSTASAPDDQSSSETSHQADDKTASTSTPPAAAKPAAWGAGPKKSWASLLQPTDATASSSKSRLPTSSVVGFSIPAGLQNGGPSQGSSAGSTVRPEVLNLLNAGPTGASAPPKIRPRGLVNTGNMCFANAVLQVLVYCPPFYRLFTELGKFLPDPVVGSQQEGTRATPLVDAIIQFLKEFGTQEDEKKDMKSKGKEREEDFDDLDSFIPTYVYDVMKEKKRFASMVVGGIAFMLIVLHH